METRSDDQSTIRRITLSKWNSDYSMLLDGMVEPDPQTPSEWFSQRFIKQASTYGAPILEEQYTIQEDGERVTRIRPLQLNEDFFAAVLGGKQRLGHQVVYYVPEGVFYFMDHREGAFVATTESKLQTLLSQYLIRCSEAMGDTVDIEKLFGELRDARSLNRIIQKAKSILAADESFFTGAAGHKRKIGGEVFDPTAEPPHKLFIREGMVVEPQQITTVKDAYQHFSRYCEIHGFTPVERKHFKSLIAEVVRGEFGLGLRNDLKVNGGRATSGWRGIACKMLTLDAGARN